MPASAQVSVVSTAIWVAACYAIGLLACKHGLSPLRTNAEFFLSQPVAIFFVGGGIFFTRLLLIEVAKHFFSYLPFIAHWASLDSKMHGNIDGVEDGPDYGFKVKYIFSMAFASLIVWMLTREMTKFCATAT